MAVVDKAESDDMDILNEMTMQKSIHLTYRFQPPAEMATASPPKTCGNRGGLFTTGQKPWRFTTLSQATLLAFTLFVATGCDLDPPTGTYAETSDPSTSGEFGNMGHVHAPLVVDNNIHQPLSLQLISTAIEDSCDLPLYRIVSPPVPGRDIGLVAVALVSPRRDIAYLTEHRVLRVRNTTGQDWEITPNAATSMAWSNNGDLLAYSFGIEPTDADLYIADVRRKIIHPVVRWTGPDTRPVFSPQDDRLAWVASVSGHPVWFVLDLQKKTPQPLFSSQFDWNPPSGTPRPAINHVIPVPTGPEPARWIDSKLTFFAGEGTCEVQVPSGAWKCEGGAP